MVNNEKGLNIFSEVVSEKIETNYNDALTGNPSIESSPVLSIYRYEFWSLYKKHGISTIEMICKKMRPSFINKLLTSYKRKIKKIMNLCGL